MSELIYGRHGALETMRAGRRRVFRLWLEGDARRRSGESIDQILAHAETANIPVRSVSGGLFDKLRQQHANSQGVALEVGGYPYVYVEEILRLSHDKDEPPLLLVLDHVQDPQNLGAIIRTAEAMAVHGVIVPKRRAADVTPAVTSASSGAVEQMLVSQVTNLNRTIDFLKTKNIWVAGLDGSPDVPEVGAASLDGPLAIVVGSEGPGLSRLAREKCDFLVRLPLFGKIESLNASVAGSIVIFLARQTRSA